jgi:hypothetical protein
MGSNLSLRYFVVCIRCFKMIGKKNNKLRGRVDDAQYSLDQLLLGTLMFSSLVFLFPTVAVYYFLFSVCRLSVILVQVFVFDVDG